MLLAIIVFIGTLGEATLERASEVSRVPWSNCLGEFVDRGAETIDPAPVLIDAAMAYCKSDEEKYRSAWIELIVNESVFKPSRQEVEARAVSVVADWYANYRASLLIRIQLRRQLLAAQAKIR